MKLLRHGPKGAEKPALLDASGVVRDLSGIVDDITGATLGADSLARLAALDCALLSALPADGRVGPCVGKVGKFICVGLNYADHARETGKGPPAEPILFLKATSAIIGPNDDVEIPVGALKTDWEVELGIVIGTRAKYVAEAQALDHVAGYCLVNDISERAFQSERGGEWTKGKSHDTFSPMGPWLVTSDEIADSGNLGMRLEVNNVSRQNGSTQTIIFGVAHLVSYLSHFMTLHPGDVVTTGTPPGVGLGMKPPLYLKAGDVMRLEIDGLGHQQQTVVLEGA